MAFEDGLDIDPSQPQEQDFVLNATGLVSKTFGLWTRKFVQYIVLVGLVSVVTVFLSFIIVLTLFSTIGVLPSDPFNYLFSIFALSTPPDFTYFALAIVFGTIVFIINAILSGAAIRFALDDYSGQTAEIGASFSHSFGKIGRILAVQVIMTLIVSVVMGPSAALMMRALEGIDITNPAFPIIDPEAIQYMMMGFGLFIGGGIVVLFIIVRFAPALAIVMDTDLSAIDSLKKAWELTSGNFLHVFGAQILLGIAIGLLSAIITIPTSFILYLDPLGSVLNAIFIGLLFSAPNLIYIAVLYRDLMARAGPVGSDLPEYVL
ncbi:MAG: hypothetical protein ACFFF9_06330 [Candidatus Thorarchaeota archaeon]